MTAALALYHYGSYQTGTGADSMDTIARALTAWPGSLRALAREAGISHVTLLRLRGGEAASAETASRVARALERTGRRCQAAAKALRGANR